MNFLLSFLLLLATAVIAVTSQCDFCSNGITLPDFVLDDVNGTTCSDLQNLNDEGCLFAGLYELVCCPGGGGSSCDFCTDGVKFPNAVVENNGETITCTEIAIAAPFFDGSDCSRIQELGTPPCCPASAISSMIAFVATAWIGYLVAF